jgi:hypothetical protein
LAEADLDAEGRLQALRRLRQQKRVEAKLKETRARLVRAERLPRPVLEDRCDPAAEPRTAREDVGVPGGSHGRFLLGLSGKGFKDGSRGRGCERGAGGWRFDPVPAAFEGIGRQRDAARLSG